MDLRLLVLELRNCCVIAIPLVLHQKTDFSPPVSPPVITIVLVSTLTNTSFRLFSGPMWVIFCSILEDINNNCYFTNTQIIHFLSLSIWSCAWPILLATYLIPLFFVIIYACIFLKFLILLMLQL